MSRFVRRPSFARFGASLACLCWQASYKPKQCLPVRRCRNPEFVGQHGQKRLHLQLTHSPRMTHRAETPMPADKELDPVHIALLGLKAVVHVPKTLAHLVKQPSGNQRRAAGFTVFGVVVITGHKYSMRRKPIKIKNSSRTTKFDTAKRLYKRLFLQRIRGCCSSARRPEWKNRL